MPQIIRNAKDGLDQMIETSSAIQTMVKSRDVAAPSSVEAAKRLKDLEPELKEIRQLLALDQPRPAVPRGARASGRLSTRRAA